MGVIFLTITQSILNCKRALICILGVVNRYCLLVIAISVPITIRPMKMDYKFFNQSQRTYFRMWKLISYKAALFPHKLFKVCLMLNYQWRLFTWCRQLIQSHRQPHLFPLRFLQCELIINSLTNYKRLTFACGNLFPSQLLCFLIS